jgi:adenine-specific DNA-methyltransferase
MDARPNLRYSIPFEGEDIWPEKQWQWARDRALAALEADELVIKKIRGKWSVNYKQYLRDADGEERGAKLYSIIEAVYTQQGTNELKAMFGDGKTFDFPKPTALVLKLIQAFTHKDSLILDSFAGSGTTGQAVLATNFADGGRRRFLLIETEEYADTITAERIRRVISGYGQGSNATLGLGGGFDYYTVGEPMFLPDENLNEAVGTEAIRGYVAYSEGIPAADRATSDNPHSPYLLGLNRETAWLFHYEPERATSLDMDFLSTLRFGGKTGANKPGTVIIYADRCLLSKAFMTQHGIIFKKIPRDITRF